MINCLVSFQSSQAIIFNSFLKRLHNCVKVTSGIFLEFTPSNRSQNRRELFGNFINSILWDLPVTLFFRGWDKKNWSFCIYCNELRSNLKIKLLKWFYPIPWMLILMSAFKRNLFPPLFFVIDKIIRNYLKSKIYFQR